MRVWIQPAKGAEPYEVWGVESAVQQNHTVHVTQDSYAVEKSEQTYDGELVKVKE